VLSYAFARSRNIADVVFLFSNPVLIAVSSRSRLSFVVHPFLNPVWNIGSSFFYVPF
jgi:hypothetical protein